MNMPEAVKAALLHVHSMYPEVTQVFYGVDGRWMYSGEAFEAPDFDDANLIVDTSLLEDGADAAFEDKGWPCAYALSPSLEDSPSREPELDEDADAVKHLIVQGNPVDGFLYYGPFDTPEDAEDYVVKYDNGQSWWRVKMTRQM